MQKRGLKMAKCKNLKDTCFEHENTFDQEKYKPTNADRIRSMTDEELAELLGTRFDVASVCENLEDGCWYKCKTHECDYDETKLIIKWLKSEVGCE